MKTTSVSLEVADLRAAKARHELAQAQVNRIAASREQAPTLDTAATDEALEAARRAYEDTAGAHALGDATEADLAQAYSRLDAAQRASNRANDDARRVHAAASGLSRRLEAAEAEATAAADALRKAEVEWLRVELRQADEAYRAASADVIAAWRRAKAAVRSIKARGARANNFAELAGMPVMPSLGVVERSAVRVPIEVDASEIEAALARAAQARG